VLGLLGSSTIVGQLISRYGVWKRYLVGGGVLLVAGFGLDRAHLPPAAGLVALADYDAWCAAAGLRLVRRLATWAGDEYDGGGYAVSIHGHRNDLDDLDHV